MPEEGAKFDLHYLLSGGGIDVSGGRVLVMRHVPDPPLRKVFPWLAADRPEIFNAYQQMQAPKVEKQLAVATHVVSCIGHRPKEALFVGVYRVSGQRPLSFEKYLALPENKELRRLGDRGWPNEHARPFPMMWTDMQLEAVLQQWKGKLVFDWPPPEVSWVRRAERNTFTVKAILEDSALDRDMPSWDRLVLTWAELQSLPKRWIATLMQWRGVYFVHDTKCAKAYVGSAYGDQNIYGRWMNYAATGDGGNKLLRDRNPDGFQFSILQLLSPVLDPESVITVESSWKDRLHTRQFGLNVN
jgi:hypothetical protein